MLKCIFYAVFVFSFYMFTPSNNINMKTISKPLTRKIDFINTNLLRINNLDSLLYTYDGGTFPFCLHIEAIETKNQYIYIKTGKNNTYSIENRYNVNNDWQLDEIKHILNLISREYKKVLR